MTITTPIRSDREIKGAVEDELEWTPGVHATEIGVSIEDGAVSLSGEVTSYTERLSAAKAALRVRGVRALVDNIVVNSASKYTRSETDLAKSVQRALESRGSVPAEVKAELNGHTLTLTGEVEWDFERQNACRAVQDLAGIDYLNNEITLRARPSDTTAAKLIEAALDRNASLDGSDIVLEITGTAAKLTGSVRTWAQRRTAESIAWSSPHVTHLDNQILVAWF